MNFGWTSVAFGISRSSSRRLSVRIDFEPADEISAMPAIERFQKPM
jgi:hypothetical protein